MNKNRHRLNRKKGLSDIELKGQTPKKVIIRVGGRPITTVDAIEYPEMEVLRTNNDDPENKEAALIHIINHEDPIALNRLVQVMDLETIVSILTTSKENLQIEEGKKRKFDCPEENKQDLLREVVTKILPKGLNVAIQNNELEFDVIISIRGRKTSI